jgi:signal transduction histidine kinase
MSPSPPSLRQACHDLSQPLMAARGSLELALQLDSQDPGRAEFLADAVAALDRMTAMIESYRAGLARPMQDQQ